MSESGQTRLLPRCNTYGRFASISRHYDCDTSGWRMDTWMENGHAAEIAGKHTVRTKPFRAEHVVRYGKVLPICNLAFGTHIRGWEICLEDRRNSSSEAKESAPRREQVGSRLRGPGEGDPHSDCAPAPLTRNGGALRVHSDLSIRTRVYPSSAPNVAEVGYIRLRLGRGERCVPHSHRIIL
jgi:hypothetical protein